MFLALLWWIIGVLAGSVAAFLVYFITPDSPDRAWPAALTLIMIALGSGIFGSFKSWQLYNKKVS